jgi:hypothetical protein
MIVTYAVGARASARRRPKHPNKGAAKAIPHLEEAGAASCAEDEPKANADASATNVRALICNPSTRVVATSDCILPPI